MKRRYRTVALWLGLGLLTGCAAIGLPQDQREKLASIAYPSEAPYAGDLDIILMRRGVAIELVNRTPQAYTDLQLWLNRQYVTPVAQLPIGKGGLLPLTFCINQYQEPFPLGGLLRSDKGFPVVQAELYDPAAQVRYRLIVQQPLE